MSIILILILLFIGLPMIGTLVMTMFGIGIWILKMLWGLFTEGFGSGETNDSKDTSIYGTELMGPLSEPIKTLCTDPALLTRETISDNVQGLNNYALDCATNYGRFSQGGYLVNTCLLSQMYVKSVLPLLNDTATDADATKNLTTGKNLTAAFCNALPDFENDLYDGIVKKFNAYESAMNTYLTTVSLDYKYNIPYLLSPSDYRASAALEFNTKYPSVKTPKSYTCATFNGDEQGLIKTLKNRIFGTPTDIDTIATTVTANVCSAKGWGNGAEASSYKGCGTSCLGCCRPSTEEPPASATAPVTGVNAVKADGTVAATGTTVDAKCPQPVLREYTLKRKPAVFKKVRSPTDALFECFEDGASEEVESGQRHLDMREAARVAKADKRATLRQHM
jgi:hypothetical protein